MFIFTNLQRYTNICEDTEKVDFMKRSKELYEDALASLPNPDPPREFQGRNNKYVTGQPKYLYLEKILTERVYCLLSC